MDHPERPASEAAIPEAEDPHALFEAWFADARSGEPNDPDAVCLATAAADGAPSARMVLLKGHDAQGFVFYTNEESRKGEELLANPRAALCFHWKSLRRQVRVEGAAERVSAAESDAYFASRSRASRLSAAASEQSRPLPSRDDYARRVAELDARFPGGALPRPAHWGGFRLVPWRIEFWKDMPHRRHDRLVYEREGEGWRRLRLYP